MLKWAHLPMTFRLETNQAWLKKLANLHLARCGGQEWIVFLVQLIFFQVNFGPVLGRQTESDAYEPIMH